MTAYLRGLGHPVNRKRVKRLMRQLGLAGMEPGPNTSRPHPQAEVYPYLLRGVAVERPNQVWSTDITYIRMARGFVYLMAVMDWHSREEALQHFGTQDIFNTDQGRNSPARRLRGA